MEQLLLSTRPFEYIAFIIIRLNIQAGPAYLFAAIDAQTGYAFNIGLTQELNDTIILQKVYELTELPEFTESIQDKPFTLVFENNAHLFESIQNIIQYHQGTPLLNKTYNHFISNPFVDDMQKRLGGRK